MELYYLYNPEALIEGFKTKDIPIAWKNTAVKRYHVLSLLLDEVARKGKSTYILGTDGSLSDLETFLNEVVKVANERKDLLDYLNAKTREEGDIDAKTLFQELLEELGRLPKRIEEWRKMNDDILRVGELLDLVRTIARRSLKLGKEVNDYEILKLSENLFKIIRRICP